MKASFTLLAMTLSLQIFAGTTMNLEGTCSGLRKDGTPVDFTYYSDFNGCSIRSKAGMALLEGGFTTGQRIFSEGKDRYVFEKVSFEFLDTTGNTEGIYKYVSTSGKRESVIVQCDVRDYHYEDCL